jgi:hypothetical protein
MAGREFINERMMSQWKLDSLFVCGWFEGPLKGFGDWRSIGFESKL